MSAFVPTKLHSREALLFCFHLKKSAAESYRMLCEAYGENAPSISTCEYWFRRFKSPGPSTPKPNIHGSKVMLCVWWDQKGIVYHELLKSGQTINGALYRQQLMRLKRAIAEKRPEWETRHETLIFHHDNARPHVAQVVKTYLDGSGWEVLPHPPYSPDLAPSDYHLFRSMQNALTGVRFTSVEGIQNWLDEFFASKSEQFYWDGIHALPEKWEKVIASDGQYFG